MPRKIKLVTDEGEQVYPEIDPNDAGGSSFDRFRIYFEYPSSQTLWDVYDYVESRWNNGQ